MQETTKHQAAPQTTPPGLITTHPFTQLVLKFTFNPDDWSAFDKEYKDNPSRTPDEYHFLNADQWIALGSRDPARINQEIVKEYSSGAASQNMDDLVGGIPLLIKDWPTHQ